MANKGNYQQLPQHVAIIMDGNRRWARKNKLPILAGHRKAAYEVIEPLVDTAIELGIFYVTLWAFSTENWRREKMEVEGLLKLFRQTLSENIEKLHKKGTRLLTIGDIKKFPPDIQKKLKDGREKTRNNRVITVIVALNYGGQDEIIRAIKKMAADYISSAATLAELKKKFDSLSIEEFDNFLDTAGIPYPDLIIRTGGEKRLSGFLLWQSAYSELYFTDTLFPDFTPEEFKKAIAEYGRRQRRFGR